MNGFLAGIPIILIRFGLLGCLSYDAKKLAAFFPPVLGKERTALWVNQVTNLLMWLCLLLGRIQTGSALFYSGLVIYVLGVFLYGASIVDFARPAASGVRVHGLYRLSRNPMYIAYFVCFLGCALLIRSWVMLGILVVFQASMHWLILSEERWCVRRFGDEYIAYMGSVRRYF